MLKNIFNRKAPKGRLEKAVEHQETQLGQAQAKARAQKLMARMDQKKREQIARQQAEAAKQAE